MDLHGSLIGLSLDNCWLPKPNFLDKWILAGQNCSCWSNGETEIGSYVVDVGQFDCFCSLQNVLFNACQPAWAYVSMTVCVRACVHERVHACVDAHMCATITTVVTCVRVCAFMDANR